MDRRQERNHRRALGPAYEFPKLAASLVKRDPAAIVGTCIPSTRAAKNATTTIPVVMSVNGDPVESGSWQAWRDLAQTLPARQRCSKN